MKRHCTPSQPPCGNYTLGGAFIPDLHCGTCHIRFNLPMSPAARAWGAEKAAPSSEPCRFEGGLLDGPDRVALGRDHARTWRRCLNAARPLGEIVCPCRGCGAACPGYQIEGDVRQQADEFLERLEPYPEGKYAGRGIVIAAGGPYWASAYVTIRMLRHVGCTLPIQVWFLGGSGERDERYERLLAPFGVSFVDIDTHPARASRRIVSGFGTKLFAVVNSSFSEVLSLDPDCYPCTDPTVLFDDRRYLALGGIYWPDGTHTDAWTNWAYWGVKKRGPCGLETGVYLLNKRTAWAPMRLAEWYDDRPEWCYGMPDGAAGVHGGVRISKGDYGDKGPHRAAWAKLEMDYVIFNPQYRWERFAFVQAGPDGWSPMFVHRCRSKFSAEPVTFSTTPQTGPNLRGGLPGEHAAFAFLDELRAAIH